MKTRMLAVFILLASISATADDRVSTAVQATVPPVYSLDSNFATTVTLDLTNRSMAELGTIFVRSNTPGWRILIRSANGGQLTPQTAGNPDRYEYRLNFGSSGDIDLSSDYELTGSSVSNRNLLAFPLSVSYSRIGDPGLLASSDTYKDTITITIFSL